MCQQQRAYFYLQENNSVVSFIQFRITDVIMAKKRKKNLIVTPFPSPKETAKKFGISKKRLSWILREALKAG